MKEKVQLVYNMNLYEGSSDHGFYQLFKRELRDKEDPPHYAPGLNRAVEDLQNDAVQTHAAIQPC